MCVGACACLFIHIYMCVVVDYCSTYDVHVWGLLMGRRAKEKRRRERERDGIEREMKKVTFKKGKRQRDSSEKETLRNEATVSKNGVFKKAEMRERKW